MNFNFSKQNHLSFKSTMPMLTQESVNAIEQVIMSTDFYAFNAHICEDCCCSEDDSERCEIFQEGITFDGSMMYFKLDDALVSIEMYIDNEHGDAEIFLVWIGDNNSVEVQFQVLLNRTLHSYLPRLEEAPSSPIIRTWGVKSFLESL